MDRRKFFKVSAPLSLTPFIINGTSISTFANTRLLEAMNCAGISERVLVIVQLKGGNDGLNTLIPMDSYASYKAIRPNIAIPDSGAGSFIPLDTTLPIANQVGLHPSMVGFKSLYDSGLMSVVQGVSYTSPNRSHFRSTDLMLTGSDGSAGYNVNTGWMGRYLNHMFPGYAGNPDVIMPDPLGLQLGDNITSLGFSSNAEHNVAINLSYNSPAGYHNIVNEVGGAPLPNVPLSEYGQELQYIMNVESSTNKYAQRITDVYNAGNNSPGANYPSHYFANQLKTVARLIQGGSKTKIFLTSLGGFDTHTNQTDMSDPSVGAHTNLMYNVSEAIKAFQDDITALGLDNKVLTVSFSEFGRKAIENDNYGTDHGNIAPMFVIGKGVEGGVLGTTPDFNEVNTQGIFNNNQIQHDYRQVLTSVLQDWLGGNDTAITETKFDPFLPQKLPLIAPSHYVDPTCYVPPLVLVPITLTSFDARVNEETDVELTWETESELNNSHFIIERSRDGIDFQDMAQVLGGGTTHVPKSYRLIDPEPYFGTSYYRLKQVDFDGTTTIAGTEVVKIDKSSELSFQLYPNPAVNETKLKFVASETTELFINIVNASGQLLRDLRLPAYKGENKIPINLSDFSSGTYFINIVTENGHRSNKKLIVTNL